MSKKDNGWIGQQSIVPQAATSPLFIKTGIEISKVYYINITITAEGEQIYLNY